MTIDQHKKCILVLTDFSGCAQKAGDYALLLAGKFDADVLLFNSYFVPVSGFDSWPNKDYPALLQKSKSRLKEEASRLQNKLAKSLKTAPIHIECVTEGGTVAENVSDMIAERKNILMVVMGGYRSHNNDDFLSGTAIAEVLAKAKCPAVIVPECELTTS